LVSADWVKRNHYRTGVRVFDVRPGVEDYLESHVPMAVHLPEGLVRGPIGGQPVRYYPPAMLAETLRIGGLSEGMTAVVYSDSANALGATMVAYALERMGWPDVALLDGGIAAYEQEHETERGYSLFEAGARVPFVETVTTAISMEDLRRNLGGLGFLVVDARPTEEYAGRRSRWMRDGHIPGSVNLPWHDLTRWSNRADFRDADDARRLLERAGVTPEKDIVVTCSTSREASLPYFVMKHVLRYPKVRVYEGAWVEWSRSGPEVESGTEPGVYLGPSGESHRED
jgi:thiosulfate/3-mercaptopyruvate sulfurtransferase